jgi:sterol desaturase/sphingolipid hydroxylase (fatty acid hydroxylase superfamily)
MGFLLITAVHAATMLSYTVLVSHIIDIRPWVIPTCYLIVGIALHSTHRLGHHKIVKEWHRAHLVGHHIYSYPEKHPTTDVYKVNRFDQYRLNTFMYVIVGIISLLLCLYSMMVRHIEQVIPIIIPIICSLYVENYIHEQFHLTNSALCKYSWFIELRRYHLIHHKKPYNKNYGAFALFFDWIMQTLEHPHP